MTKAIYPGSFDPPTNGHFDMIVRAARLFDRLEVAVLRNTTKNPLFSTEERVSMIRELVSDIENVSVTSFDGLTMDFAAKTGANIIVRGLRAVTDFDYELQIAQTNRVLNTEVDTVFLATSLHNAYLSSTIVKEVAQFGGDISKFVPGNIAKHVYDKFNENKGGPV